MIPQINHQKNLEHGTYYRTINSVSWINPLARKQTNKKQTEGTSYKWHFGDNQGNLKNGQAVNVAKTQNINIVVS